MVWRIPTLTDSGLPILRGPDRVLVGEHELDLVDLGSGTGTGTIRTDATHTVGLGGRVAGPHGVSLLKL